jgi:hypothetical protein
MREPSKRLEEKHYRGNLAWVPWTVTAQKTLDTIGSLQRQIAEEPLNPYQEMAPPLKAKEEGPPT